MMATSAASYQPRRYSRGFGQFCVDLAEQFTRSHVLKLATVLEFSVAEIGGLKTESDPAHDFVNYLREKGIIQEDNITSLTDALERNNLQGIADNISRSFDENVQSSRDEITDAPPVNEESEAPDSSLNPEGIMNHEEYPYVSISDFEDCKNNLHHLDFLNGRSAKECEKLFQNYTLKLNRSEERPPLRDLVSHLRVVMLGKMGSGKSATANSLLGGEFFYHGDSARSVTDSSGIATSKIADGRGISVVDSPGLKDTDRTDKDVMGEIARVAYLLREGVHAFLFVWNGSDCRFSEGDADAIALFMREFKEEFTNRCLVVYSKAEGTLRSKTLDVFIDEQKEHPGMETFLNRIGWKVVAVNNKTEVPAEKKRNQDVLVDMIDRIVSNNRGMVYTNEVFQKAQAMHSEVVDRCNSYHPALVSAVIELYNSVGYSRSDRRDFEVLKILKKSKTGEISESKEEVVLTDGNGQQTLRYNDYNKQILELYSIFESGIKNSSFYRDIVSYTAAGMLGGAVAGAVTSAATGAVTGALTGASASAVTGASASAVTGAVASASAGAVTGAIAVASAGALISTSAGAETDGPLTYGLAAGAFYLIRMLEKNGSLLAT